MKKSLFIVAAAVVMAGCGSKNYTLSVTFNPEFDGTMAYLSYDEQRDSVEIVGGKAVFVGKESGFAKVASVYAIKERRQASGQVVLEAGAPQLDLTGRESVCSGTLQNDILNEYNISLDKLSAALRERQNELRKNESLSDAERNALIKEDYERYEKGSKELNEAFFAANKDRIIGGLALWRLGRGNKVRFDSLYNIAGEAARNYDLVVYEKARFERLVPTSEGKMFTDFTIEHGAADGSSVSLSDYVGRGKYVLVDFWASWCGPCRAEIPNVKSVYEKYKGDEFEIVGIAVSDERKDTERAVAELGITWPVIYDAQRIPGEIYAFDGIPHFILFGPDGTIIARNLRGEKIGEKIAECLGR